MGSPVLIKNRYEIRDVLGRGGMGVVYKAFDTLMRRDVAVKTLRDVASSVFVDLFYRECSVLTAMVHPNIVEIFDMGEFEEDGLNKPYFVMPLLPGRTLYDLIYPSNQPVPVERCIDIVSQSCRGLHAAHECGLLHRDLKPRNIFVMRDDAVKLIDFGVVRLLGSQTIGAPGTLGTLHYMAPEQIAMKPLTARSDIFSLATVCYEALTAVHPFMRNNETETAAAVMEQSPVLASSLNPNVNRALAQAVAQAMAKDPRNRFESAAAFADALQRGLRNERPGTSLLTNPQNRLARAQRSFARGDFEFTQEILDQLQAEGVDSREVQDLRAQLAEAVRQQQTDLHLTTARRYFDEEEYVLALRRVSEILDQDPSHSAALSLKRLIEDKLNDLQISESMARAGAHLENGAFTEARRILEGTLQVRPDHAGAQRLLQETEKRAADWPRQRQQQEELFQTAQAAYFEGHLDTAIRTLDQLAELTRQSRAAGARVTEYKDFYKRVRGDYDSLQSMLADARKLLANGELEGAFALSERLREQCPQVPDVRALSKDIAAQRDAKAEDFRRGIVARIANEPDLSARLHILTQAARARPTDEYFHEERLKLQTQLQKVNELIQRAQVYESSGRYDYAIEEWLCVGDVYPSYPGLQDQLARIKQSWRDARSKAKSELAASVNSALKRGDQDEAAALLDAAQTEFSGDADYSALQNLVQSTGDSHREVNTLLGRVRRAESERRLGDVPTLCHVIAALSQNIDPLREKSFRALTDCAARITPQNWRVAKQVADEAATLGTLPPSVLAAIAGQQREEEVAGILGEERTADSDLELHRERVANLLSKYPGETRLEDRLRLLDLALTDKRKADEKKSCAAELSLLYQELGDANDHRRLWDTYIRAKNLSAPYSDDPEIYRLLEALRSQSVQFEEAADALTRDRIKDCYSICDEMLARRPGHVLFQKLRDQAGERHRLLGEEYFARVERWLASEPDVFEREAILRRAQDEYPFDTRYSDELKALQREKAVADSLAAKARDYEKRGLMPEALAHWRQLRNLHAGYPGVDESIAECEAVVDRAQRKGRAQRLLASAQAHLNDGHFAQGYQLAHEATELTSDLNDQMRLTAPHLVAAARNAIPTNPKLAEAMVNLALRLDGELRLPKDMRARIGEARRAEDLTDCLETVKAHQEAGSLTDALAAAEDFLAKYPGIRQVEALRTRLLIEMEQESKRKARGRALDQFREMELSAANMNSAQLLDLAQNVQSVAHLNPGDEEVHQRASTLNGLFGALAEVRGHLEEGSLTEAEEACLRAISHFPGHPLFKAAFTEANRQKAEVKAQSIAGALSRFDVENDLDKKAEILREQLNRYPSDAALKAQMAEVSAQQAALQERLNKAREFEDHRQFAEATKEWEAIGQEYPWFSGVGPALERVSAARRQDKQDALGRWFGQVDSAIDNGDYETAGTMLKQAAQQQSDKNLQALEAKLAAGLKKKRESDEQFSKGSELLADGDLVEGANTLYRAFELQPKDQNKANSIALLLLGQVRAHMDTDLASCEVLLSQLDRIRPGQMLPPDISEVLAGKKQTRGARQAVSRKLLEQVRALDAAAEKSRSQRALAGARKKLQESGLLDSKEPEVRRAAGDVLRKIDVSMSGVGKPPIDPLKNELTQEPSSGLSLGAMIAAGLLLLAFAVVVFFLLKPQRATVPVSISLTPDQSTVQVDGRTCVWPDCAISLKPGTHLLRISKDGFLPKTISLEVKESNLPELKVTAALDPVPVEKPAVPSPAPVLQVPHAPLARVEIRGGRPQTFVYLDGSHIGSLSETGSFTTNVPTGTHTIVLLREGLGKSITHKFTDGELFSLANDAIRLEPVQSDFARKGVD